MNAARAEERHEMELDVSPDCGLNMYARNIDDEMNSTFSVFLESSDKD
jgi:hypothetical protein